MAKSKPESIRSVVPSPTAPLSDRFRLLYEESQKFCEGVGLPKDLIITILKTDSDWAFVLKVDALMESAAKHILRHGLRIKLLNKTFQNDTLEEFVDSLPMNGRTSLLKLLEAAGLPDEELGFLEVMRLVRNAFAHNIEYAGLRLIDLIKVRQDKSRLIKYLSAIRTYDEAGLIADYEKKPIFLRFCIIDSVMRVLFYAYHLAVKEKPQPKLNAQMR
jgi:hypothetical protein